MNKVKVGSFEIGGGEPLALLAGPCVLESLDRCLYIGRTIKDICDRLGIPYVFKASFDKANRSSYHSFRGPGLKKGLEMLKTIKEELEEKARDEWRKAHPNELDDLLKEVGL